MRGRTLPFPYAFAVGLYNSYVVSRDYMDKDGHRTALCSWYLRKWNVSYRILVVEVALMVKCVCVCPNSSLPTK